MSTANLKFEVQTRIDALVYSSGTLQAKDVLRGAIDSIGLDLDISNLINIHTSMTSAITSGTDAKDITALNAASVALGITKNYQSTSIIGDVKPLNVDSIDGLYTNLAGEKWIRSGNVSLDTSAFPDAATDETPAGVYTGETKNLSPAISSANRGITQGVSTFWILGYSDKTVYKFTDWVYTSESFSVLSEMSAPYAIVDNGSELWLIGAPSGGGLKAFKYSYSGVYSGVSVDISSIDLYPRDVQWTGTDFLLLGGENSKVYRFDSLWNYDPTFEIDLSGETTSSVGMVYDQSSETVWVADQTTKEVFKYSIITKLYLDSSFVITPTSAGVPSHMRSDGIFIYISVNTSNDVYKFTNNAEYVGLLDEKFDTDTGLPFYTRIA